MRVFLCLWSVQFVVPAVHMSVRACELRALFCGIVVYMAGGTSTATRLSTQRVAHCIDPRRGVMVKLRSAFAFVAVALALIEVCTAGFARDVSLHVPLGAVLSRSSQPEALLGRGLPSRILTAKAVEEQAVEAVEKTIFIKATPEECFRVASGYEDYPKWDKETCRVPYAVRTTCVCKLHDGE